MDEVERVARAICGADGTNPDKPGKFTGKPLWTLFEEEAQAAIAAMPIARDDGKLREALKRARWQVDQMDREKVWISADVNSTLRMCDAALASTVEEGGE